MRALSVEAPQLRPLGAGEIIDASVRIYRRHFKTLTLAVLVVVLPVVVLNTLVTASTIEGAFDLSREDVTIEDEGSAIAGQVISGVLSLIAFTLALAACFYAVSRAYLGGAMTWTESLRAGGRRLPAVIALGILYVLGVLFGLLGVIVLSVFLAIRWAVSVPALLAEDLGPVAALGRSFRLVKGRWWATFATLIVMYILVSILQFVLVGGLTALMFADSDNEVLVATMQTIGSVVAYAVTLPIQAAVLTLIYYDLRVRKEGFDLQLLAERIGGDTGVVTAAPSDSGLGSLAPENPTYAGGFSAPSPPAPPGSQRPTERE